MESLLLDKIDQPSDLKKLNAQQVEKLCAEIRHFMLENISKTGGHLASNLGTVELTVALHRVLETPKDKIVFDVGHQCYTHKLLTGRRKQFDHLRQLDGISGFPNPHESVHDAFIPGHGNTALSLAIGMAWAKKNQARARACGSRDRRWCLYRRHGIRGHEQHWRAGQSACDPER